MYMELLVRIDDSDQKKGKKFSLVKTVSGKERTMSGRAGQTVRPRIPKEKDRPAN